jgi:hypothetical protein
MTKKEFHIKKEKKTELVHPNRVNEIIEAIAPLSILEALQYIYSEKSLMPIDRMFVSYEYGRQIGENMGYAKGYQQGQLDQMAKSVQIG